MPTRFTSSCARDERDRCHSPSTVATATNAAAGTVVTEMKTPTKALDFAEVRDRIPAAPASNAMISENGPGRRRYRPPCAAPA